MADLSTEAVRLSLRLLRAIWPLPVKTRAPKTSTRPEPQAPEAPKTSVVVALPGLEAPEPLGWFSALVAHGGACMAFEIEYMTGSRYGKRYHLLPNLKAGWGGDGNPFLVWKHKVSPMAPVPDGLLTNTFREWPCPVYPRTGPTFLLSDHYEPYAFNGGTADEWRQACDKDTGIGEVSWIVPWGPASERHLCDGRIAVDGDGYLVHKGNYNGSTWGRVHPGKRVASWATETAAKSTSSDAYAIGIGRGLVGTPVALLASCGPDYGKRAVWVPKYWRESDARLRDFWERLLRWYYTARWIVWAGEMLREHARTAAPGWWSSHCLAWAVGVPQGDVKARPSYSSREPSLELAMGTKDVLELLRLVVRHTPPPGSALFTGAQIAPPDGKRVLCDIPAAAGSVAPPIALLDDDGEQFWATYAVSQFKKHEQLYPWLKVVGPILDALISAAGSGLSGAVSSGVQAAAGAALGAVGTQVVHVVASYALKAIVALGRGSLDFDAGDVVGLASDALAASGLGDEALKHVPPEMWGALKTAGAALPELRGGDWQQALPKLRQLQNALENVQEFEHWDFADAAYGGLGLSKGTRDGLQKAGVP